MRDRRRDPMPDVLRVRAKVLLGFSWLVLLVTIFWAILFLISGLQKESPFGVGRLLTFESVVLAVSALVVGCFLWAIGRALAQFIKYKAD